MADVLNGLSKRLNQDNQSGKVQLWDSDGMVVEMPFAYPAKVSVKGTQATLNPPPAVMALVSAIVSNARLLAADGSLIAQTAIEPVSLIRGGLVSVDTVTLDESGNLSLIAAYDSNVSRPIAADLCMAQQQGMAFRADIAMPSEQGSEWEQTLHLPHRHAMPSENRLCFTLEHSAANHSPQWLSYRHGIAVSDKSCLSFEDTLPVWGDKISSPYRWGIPVFQTACSDFQSGIVVEPDKTCIGFEQAVFINGSTCSLFAASIQLEIAACQPYQQGLPLPCPCTVTVDTEPEPQPDPTPEPDPEPVPEPKPTNPYKTVFIVNEFALIDVKSGKQIPCLSASVATDKNSYAWQFDLSLPYNTPKSVQEIMRELEIRINGYVWRMLVTGRSRGEQFGQTTINLNGYSPTVLLTEPYAPTRNLAGNLAMTAKALATEEIERADLSTGFALDWQITDPNAWQIPENAFSYEAQTPMQVIKTIAEAGGGWVYSHMNKRELSVKPNYPQPFWAWQKPDLTIPDSLIFSRDRQYNENPLYNAVYVSGTDKGITAYVRRSGTAGDYQASMVTDALITDEAVARQRGIAELGKGGRIETVSLEMPLHSDLGVILPNTLVGVSNWLGLSDKISIRVSWQNGLKIRQTVEVERHLDQF